MSLYEFKRNDFFHNVLKAHPKSEFFIYNGKTFYNSRVELSGTFTGEVGHHSTGEISLYEMNVDRPASALIYPFTTKQGSRESFSTVSTSDFNSNFSYGDQLTGTYPLTSSLHRERYASGVTSRPRITALKNTLKTYTIHGEHFYFTSSMRDLAQAEVSLYSIPSIFFGSGIKKGSVVFIFLTGTTDLSNSEYTEQYIPGGSVETPQWTHFGVNAASNATSSYVLAFSGTSHTNVLTMLAHAKSGDLYYSNNPTFLNYSSSASSLGEQNSTKVYRQKTVPIKNIVSSSYYKTDEAHEKTVYISKIGIYDEDKNLVGIAKLASPIRKRLNDEYTFKLKLDI
jgi:hypothetical protein